MALVGRRALVRAGLAWGAAGSLAGSHGLLARLAAQGCDSPPLGELVGLVPLHGDRPRGTPLGTLVGGPGLDARLLTDLSTLQPDRLLTPTPEMFVRTTAPPALRQPPASWTIALTGFASSGPKTLDLASLRRQSAPMGAHLIECSGNADPDNFGLMSVTDWEGVPLAPLIRDLGPRPSTAGILVSGVDDHEGPSRTSTAGASWVLPLSTLDRLGAFLAVGMNKAPLTPDHGAPVRLVVPGWYGCAWIKWVSEIGTVGADEPTTSQMREFSQRTHQGGVPVLARDYEPPVIDLAATPVRVEKRRLDGRLEYRVVGIVWGGQRPVDRLLIRFRSRDAAVPFAICPVPQSHRTWSLWDYRWRPPQPGVYDIVLRAGDPTIRTRRLDISYYLRRVIIDEV
ncbi:MAG: molybdopterin-dependent oxidoreductase [Acidobacteriota bacterium]